MLHNFFMLIGLFAAFIGVIDAYGKNELPKLLLFVCIICAQLTLILNTNVPNFSL